MTSTRSPDAPTLDGEEPLRFEPPGRGSWLLLADHFPDPVTPEYARTWIPTMSAANATLASRYGIPLAGIEGASVHGYLYLRPVPLVGSNARAMPPAALLRLGARLHPKLRACRSAAERALRDRPWLAVVDDWERTVRPAWIARNVALQHTDLATATPDELAEHLLACRQAWYDGYVVHFEYHGSDQLPVAAYLVRGEQLGLGRHELLDALTGWSPASVGHDETLRTLRAAVATAVGDGAPPRTLDEIRSLGEEAAEALDDHLERYGWRMVTSYDLEGRALIELPELVVARITDTGSTSDPTEARAASDEVARRLRAKVSIEDRAEFDRLLGDARATYGLRDDNGAIVGAWPVGLTRRAYLEAGRRLHESGRLLRAEHVFELLAEEVAELLRGGHDDAPGPTLRPDAVAERAERRRAAAAAQAPLALGRPMELPDASVLPAAMALLTQAQVLLAEDTGLTSSDRAAADDRTDVSGSGIGSGSVEGIARVALDPAVALAEIEPGEVLVARSTNPAWNAVLPLVAGLVVEEGGALSHAAIISRELGLPAVIGASAATTVIRTGDRVMVDAATGTARVTDRR